MADSPALKGGETVKATIYSEGNAIDSSFQLVSICICKKINNIPYAKLTFIDGDMPSGDFPQSNKDTFSPGKKIKIDIGYGQSQETVFEGIVVKHGISINSNNSAKLVIEVKDKAVKMTIGRNNATYLKQKDDAILKELISNAGLNADVSSTTTTHEQLIQYYATDWDFLMTRADVNGLITIVDAGKVSVKAPATDKTEVLKVSYGMDLMEFSADVNATTQLASVKSSGWKIAEQKPSEQTGSAPSLNNEGDFTSKKLSDVAAPQNYQLQSAVPEQETSLKAWADACLLKAGLSMIQGSMKFQGNAKAKPGTIIEIERLGKHFNGKVFVSSVYHSVRNGNWTTEVEFGFSNDWYVETQTNIAAPGASGLLPPIEGLHIGTVQKLDGDPNDELRIQVQCPLLGEKVKPIWARLSNFYGFNQYGAFFIPEIGSEVILGFFNNDPRHPVILGSLYSSKNKAPYEISADNFTKAIVTKNKLKLEFDDEKKVTTIETPGGNKIVISDDAKSILLNDQNNNKVELNESGILMDSPKDIKIISKGKVSIEGTGGIELKSSADVKTTGMNINQTANASYVAKGSASAEFSASGTTTIKGAMVMIN